MNMNQIKVETSTPVRKHWLGLGAVVAALVCVVGRLVLEPLRSVPHFNADGMDPYCSVETFRLNNDPHPLEVAFFGSSVSIWGVITDEVARELGKKPESLRSLAMQGGTAFQMWQLVKRNPDKFSQLQMAVLEVGPRTVDDNLRGDPMVLALAQTASLAERWSIDDRAVRRQQVTEWFFPWRSVRRSLQSAVLDVVKPLPGLAIYPEPDARLYPAYHWHVRGDDDDDEGETFVSKTTPQDAARRIISGWNADPFLDTSLRELLAWFHERHIKVALVEMPVHPQVADLIRGTAKFAESYNNYALYLESLGIPQSQIIRTMDPSSGGVPVDGMRDYQHLNRKGARIYSSFLGQQLRSLIP